MKPMSAAIVLAGWVGSASASVVTYTYTGTVDYGYDRAGLFGATPDLTGQAFRLVETFDTGTAAYRYVDALQSLQFGGTDRGAPRSAGLVVTIGGRSRAIADLEDYIYSGAATGKHLDFVKDRTGYEYGGFYVESSRLLADYGSPLTLTAADATFIGSYQFFDSRDVERATYASLAVSSLRVTNSAFAGGLMPVPLPGALGLFGGGLAALGLYGFGRRRRPTA